MTCARHPLVTLQCPACVAEHGALCRSERQRKASRENGRKGGRPRKVQSPA